MSFSSFGIICHDPHVKSLVWHLGRRELWLLSFLPFFPCACSFFPKCSSFCCCQNVPQPFSHLLFLLVVYHRQHWFLTVIRFAWLALSWADFLKVAFIYIYEYTHTNGKIWKNVQRSGKYAGKEWEDGFLGKIICMKTWVWIPNAHKEVQCGHRFLWPWCWKGRGRDRRNHWGLLACQCRQCRQEMVEQVFASVGSGVHTFQLSSCLSSA